MQIHQNLIVLLIESLPQEYFTTVQIMTQAGNTKNFDKVVQILKEKKNA